MKHLALPVMMAVLFLPGTVHAYVEPEDVLFGNEDAVSGEDLHGAASSARSSRARSSVPSDDGLHGAAPTESGLSPRTERLLERINRQETDPEPVAHAPQAEILHSGAPAMSHTGPETAIALAMLGIASLSTVAFARAGRTGFIGK